jgi:hypothetical protein
MMDPVYPKGVTMVNVTKLYSLDEQQRVKLRAEIIKARGPILVHVIGSRQDRFPGDKHDVIVLLYNKWKKEGDLEWQNENGEYSVSGKENARRLKRALGEESEDYKGAVVRLEYNGLTQDGKPSSLLTVIEVPIIPSEEEDLFVPEQPESSRSEFELISVKQAAGDFGIRRETLLAMVDAGKLMLFRYNSVRLLRMDELKACLGQSRRKSQR